MSNQSQQVQSSAHSITLSHTTMNALAEKLQEVAQTILDLSKDYPTVPDPEASPERVK